MESNNQKFENISLNPNNEGNTTKDLEILIIDLEKIYMKDWTENHKVNILSITHFAMKILEDFSQKKEFKFKGDEKHQFVIKIIPLIINSLKLTGFLNEEKAVILNNVMISGSNIIDDFIHQAIEISKTPHKIQIKNDDKNTPTKTNNAIENKDVSIIPSSSLNSNSNSSSWFFWLFSYASVTPNS